MFCANALNLDKCVILSFGKELNPFTFYHTITAFNDLEKNSSENIVGKRSCHAAFSPFYTPVEDGTYYGITRGGRAGARRPVLCPEHISKTTLPRVMKFHGWIDLIQGECSVQES